MNITYSIFQTLNRLVIFEKKNKFQFVSHFDETMTKS